MFTCTLVTELAANLIAAAIENIRLPIVDALSNDGAAHMLPAMPSMQVESWSPITSVNLLYLNVVSVSDASRLLCSNICYMRRCVINTQNRQQQQQRRHILTRQMHRADESASFGSNRQQTMDPIIQVTTDDWTVTQDVCGINVRHSKWRSITIRKQKQDRSVQGLIHEPEVFPADRRTQPHALNTII